MKCNEVTEFLKEEASTAKKTHTSLHRKSSILSQLYDKKHFTSKEFRRLWDFYDKDGNGYLEYAELERFLRDLTEVTLGTDVDQEEYRKFQTRIMAMMDANKNGKLEARELSKIIPTEENFLLCYSIQSQNAGATLTCQDFLDIWTHYDKDASGYIDQAEAKDFMADLLKVNSVRVDLTNVTYLDTFFRSFDMDENGVIEIDEMASIFPVEEKFRNALKQRKQFTKDKFDKVYNKIDTDKKGSIAATKLPDLLRDLVKSSKVKVSESEILEMSDNLKQMLNKDEVLYNELSMIVSSHHPPHKKKPISRTN